MTKSKDTKPNNSSRRKILKAGAAVGAVGSAALLPNSWVKPVLRTVVVPAHAKTTDVTTTTTKKPRRTTRRPRRTTRRPKPTTTNTTTRINFN